MLLREQEIAVQLRGLRALATDQEAQMSDLDLLAGGISIDPHELLHGAALDRPRSVGRAPQARWCGAVATV